MPSKTRSSYGSDIPRSNRKVIIVKKFKEIMDQGKNDAEMEKSREISKQDERIE